MLREFIESIKSHKRERALDVAAGDGRLTKALLLDLYERTDLFDKCKKAW